MQLSGFFDLRDRETFIQITNVSPDLPGETYHIQLFNVGNLCNENNFLDFYTPNDTHVYNLRDITRNDGKANSVLLPDDAYGIFVAYVVNDNNKIIIGNLRILDNNGYEYRTNLVGVGNDTPGIPGSDDIGIFHFNTESGVTLSDIVGFQSDEDSGSDNRLLLTNIIETWTNWDVDIVDLNEDVSSCRSVAFSCNDQDHPLLPELLNTIEADASENAATVASFEYGINEAIPSSKGAPLLCPGNIVSEGYVRLELDDVGDDTENEVTIFVGLNNGNGRGSMDVFITKSRFNTNGGGGG